MNQQTNEHEHDWEELDYELDQNGDVVIVTLSCADCDRLLKVCYRRESEMYIPPEVSATPPQPKEPEEKKPLSEMAEMFL